MNKIYYWKDIKFLARFETEDNPNITQEEFNNEYTEVYVDKFGEEFPYKMDYYFQYLQDRKFDLPAGVKHTSMSVGDIVQIGKRDFYAVLPGGWKYIYLTPKEECKPTFCAVDDEINQCR